MYRITLLLLFLASNCAGIKGKDFFRWSTSSSSSSVTSAPGTPTSDEPPEKCECLDGTSLQDDVDKILNKLDAVLRQETNLTILPHISSKLSAIQTAVQDKTCQCQNGDALLELEENTNNIIKNILQFANDSSTCACNNTNLIYNITETMLARLKSLGDLSGATHNIVKTCDTEMAEIKHKLDIIIKEKGHGGGKCDLSELEQDLNHIIYLLETILRRILEIIQRGCPCKEEIKELEKKICDKIDSVMEKLDENADSNGCNLDSIKEILEKMDKKLDKITGGNIASTTINQCNCITYKQFIEIIPLYCVKQQRDKKVEDWELSAEATDELLSDYEMCIKKAIRDLEAWFKPDTWNAMPAKVKTILINIYCKLGFKEMKYFFQSRIKPKLELGNWRDAAYLLRRTLWARRRDPESAERLSRILEDVGRK